MKQETAMCIESYWVNLNEKIFARQPQQEKLPFADLRTPWQISRQDPPKKKPCPLNSYVKLTLEA